MKIKDVCLATSLSDRAIRFYIEQKLIDPCYTENYLGRKSFDFTEDDIRALKEIAILRKFGFSVSEIRQMLEDPEQILPLSLELRKRKQDDLAQQEQQLHALSAMEDAEVHTVSELAALLSSPTENIPLPDTDVLPHTVRRLLSLAEKILTLAIILLPVAALIAVIVNYFILYRYPVLSPQGVLIFTLLFCWPSALLLIGISRRGKRKKRVAKFILLLLCAVLTPIHFFTASFALSLSETENHHDYREFDVHFPANRDAVFQQLFPAELSFGHTRYHYLYSLSPFGTTAYVYVEWDEEELSSEITRVEKMFSDWEGNLEYTAGQRGAYTYYALSDGSPPFAEEAWDHTHYLFAYDAENHRVRYIFCHSDCGGALQYPSLVW